MMIQYKGERKADIIPNKIYHVLSIENGWYRIIDESGEDYLYEPSAFYVVDTELVDSACEVA